MMDSFDFDSYIWFGLIDLIWIHRFDLDWIYRFDLDWIYRFDLDWIHIFDCSNIPFEWFDGPEKGRFVEKTRAEVLTMLT